MGPATHIIRGAYTRAGARVISGGRTSRHWRCTYQKMCPTTTVCCIDEIALVPLSLQFELRRYSTSRGKRLPIPNGWLRERMGGNDSCRQMVMRCAPP